MDRKLAVSVLIHRALPSWCLALLVACALMEAVVLRSMVLGCCVPRRSVVQLHPAHDMVCVSRLQLRCRDGLYARCSIHLQLPLSHRSQLLSVTVGGACAAGSAAATICFARVSTDFCSAAGRAVLALLLLWASGDAGAACTPQCKGDLLNLVSLQRCGW